MKTIMDSEINRLDAVLDDLDLMAKDYKQRYECIMEAYSEARTDGAMLDYYEAKKEFLEARIEDLAYKTTVIGMLELSLIRAKGVCNATDNLQS